MNHNQKLFKSSIFTFWDIEVGAPGLYDFAPFGGKEKYFLKRVSAVLDIEYSKNEDVLRKLANKYIDFCLSLPILISEIELPVGVYKVVDVHKVLHKIFDRNTEDIANKEIEKLMERNFQANEFLEEFEVTRLHKEMLKHHRWNIEYYYNKMCNLKDLEREREKMVGLLLDLNREENSQNDTIRFNVPIVCGEPKRPYGDRTYYYWDLEDLGIEGMNAQGAFEREYGRKIFSEAQMKKIDQIQRELALVLQAMVLYGKFK